MARPMEADAAHQKMLQTRRTRCESFQSASEPAYDRQHVGFLIGPCCGDLVKDVPKKRNPVSLRRFLLGPESSGCLMVPLVGP